MSSSKFMLLRLVLCLQILLMALAHEPKRKFCGSVLTESMSIVCRNKYNSNLNNNPDKRSDDYGEDDAYINDERLAYPMFGRYQPIQFGSYFGSTKGLGELGSRVRRNPIAVQRGVYYECCLNPCTFKDLEAYCG